MSESSLTYLTDDEIAKLLAQFNDRYLNPTRNKVMVQLFLAAGLTLSEMINLKWKNLDLQEGELTVIKDGRVDSELDIADEVIIQLIDWQQKQLEEIGEIDLVFTTGSGTKLSPNQVYTTIDTYASKAGIQEEVKAYYEREEGMINMFEDSYLKRRVNPTALRNTFAINRLKEGRSINQVADLLGQKNPSNIRYYEEVLKEESN
ncbi:MAG: tyrosine-type recombinase/integrase [Halanaerobacter sp.]